MPVTCDSLTFFLLSLWTPALLHIWISNLYPQSYCQPAAASGFSPCPEMHTLVLWSVLGRMELGKKFAVPGSGFEGIWASKIDPENSKLPWLGLRYKFVSPSINIESRGSCSRAVSSRLRLLLCYYSATLACCLMFQNCYWVPAITSAWHPEEIKELFL